MDPPQSILRQQTLWTVHGPSKKVPVNPPLPPRAGFSCSVYDELKI